MIVTLALAVGFLVARAAWLLLRPTFALPVFARENHRGRTVPTGAGVVLAVSVLVVEGGRALAGAAGIGSAAGPTLARVLVVVVVLAFALVGVVDDLAGTGDPRGFRGHVAALGRGRVTSGGLKLVAGAAAALIVAGAVDGDHFGRVVADAALVALSANLGNLVDRAPGRAIKAGALGFAVVAIAANASIVLTGVAVVVGAAMALLGADLREHLMLGDAGANALGGVVGLGAVLALSPATRTAALVVVAGLNLLSEIVSFGRVIDDVAPLRALDRWGRAG